MTRSLSHSLTRSLTPTLSLTPSLTSSSSSLSHPQSPNMSLGSFVRISDSSKVFFVLTRLIRVSLITTLPRQVEVILPAVVEGDEEMGTEVTPLHRYPGLLKLLS
eukprot:TRINITY_DN2422_c0_g4_i1.p1 TRINITY_DN2422_c0_g4~~TRINITY_DN2422_c0_g4_i1.p1  ORF type:complete len:105 (-),score=21.00 TRINITY_DN2422_c0_g4_i1:215-529(-)